MSEGPEASRRLERIQAEQRRVVEELAGAVESSDPALAELIRKGVPESLHGAVRWALPHLRAWSRDEDGRLIFEEHGFALLSRIGALYADVLLRNHDFLVWRVGSDPENPTTYIYQNAPVIGVRRAGEEVDPFAVALNVLRGALRGTRREDGLLTAYRYWIKDAKRAASKSLGSI
jgi:hypothetical protein